MPTEVTNPCYYELIIHRGFTPAIPSFVFKDTSGDPVDLTNCWIFITISPNADIGIEGDESEVLFYDDSRESDTGILMDESDGQVTPIEDYTLFTDWEATGEGHTYEELYWRMGCVYPDGTREGLFYGPCHVR